jgi:uncharacterized membrane protein YkoI
LSYFLTAVLLLGTAVAMGAGDAFAVEERLRREDHDVARAALERGEILPLETILARVRESVRGDVVGVELERDCGAWIYEIKIIGPGVL